jgi:hypothetical protein
MMYFTKTEKKKRQKLTILNRTSRKNIKDAGLKFAVSIPITIMEL